MYTTYIFMMKYENFPKIFLNTFFLELSEEFLWDSKNKFESATANEPSVFEAATVNEISVFESSMVHEPSVFESLEFYCT